MWVVICTEHFFNKGGRSLSFKAILDLSQPSNCKHIYSNLDLTKGWTDVSRLLFFFFLQNLVWLIFTGLYPNKQMIQTSVICEFVPEYESYSVGGCSYIQFINMASELELVNYFEKKIIKYSAM